MTLSRRHFMGIAVGAAALGTAATRAAAKTPQVYANDGIAIDGTDPVAYFTQGAPVAGSAEITHDWNGATWRFATTANRDAFAATPDAYAPQFGGYCSYAVSEGYTASTTPEAWKIVDGKLYLNYSKRVQRWWERDIPTRIANAQKNWPGVLD